jgi:hypothetical protein
VRHAEAQVGCAEGRIHAELLPEQREGLQGPHGVPGVGAGRHRERVDDDVLERDLVLVRRGADELPR